tara:strand:- start:48 stop:257 length:210 start_codon:yes stop_codon:yes gene_type:complete
MRLLQTQIQIDPMQKYEGMGAKAYGENKYADPDKLCPFAGDFRARWMKGFCEARRGKHSMTYIDGKLVR